MRNVNIRPTHISVMRISLYKMHRLPIMTMRILHKILKYEISIFYTCVFRGYLGRTIPPTGILDS